MDQAGYHSVSKKRLRPWLEALINSNQIEGLCWINSEKSKFRIPWWHAGRQDWQPERGRIFLEWAKHTGRYREGIDSEDWVTWKTRLRCALSKASDIIEIKGESQTSIDCDDPYKVYEFKSRRSGKNKMPAKCHVTDACSNSQSQLQVSALPAVLDVFAVNSDEHMPSDLKDIPSGELLHGQPINVSDVVITDISDTSSFNNLLPDLDNDSHVCKTNCEFEVKLFYCNKLVVEKICKAQSGCWIYYGEGQMSTECLPMNVALALYAEPRAEPLWLPPCTNLMSNEKLEQHVQTVLERGMERGILVQCVDNDIVVYRLCKCSIFHGSDLGTMGNPVKLPFVLREKIAGISGTVVFDYQKLFRPALDKYASNHGDTNPPDPRVYLLIGAEKRIDDIYKDSSVPVYATVTSCRALSDVRTVMAQKGGQAAFGELDILTNDVNHMSLEAADMQSVDWADLDNPDSSRYSADILSCTDLIRFVT
jgi:hypothetical protein